MNCYNCKGEYKIREWHNGLNTVLLCSVCYNHEKWIARLVGAKTPPFNKLPLPVQSDNPSIIIAINQDYDPEIDWDMSGYHRHIGAEEKPFFTIKLEKK